MADTVHLFAPRRIQTTVDRDLHAKVKRLMAKQFLAGNPLRVVDVMDEALQDWIKATRKKGERRK